MRGLFLLLVFLLTVQFVQASVLINEFTVDPQTDWNANNDSSGDSGDEWFEIFNNGESTVDLTNWQLFLIDTTNATENLTGSIEPNQYLIISNPTGAENNDGQLILKDSSGITIDSVTFGDWANTIDNAPTGNADSITNECLARFPDGTDSNTDSTDFIKTACTFNSANTLANQSTPQIGDNQQGLNATVSGIISFKLSPTFVNFGLVNPGSTNNPAINGPIILDVSGSTTEVNVEITQVSGFLFENGLKINGNAALASSWNFKCTIIQGTCAFTTQTLIPTLDVSSNAPAGNTQGIITYTVFGNP